MILICQQMIIRLLVIAVIICLTITDTIQLDKSIVQDQASTQSNKNIVKGQENVVPSNHKPNTIMISTTQKQQQQPPQQSINQKVENDETGSKIDKISIEKRLEINGGRVQTQKLQKKNNIEQLEHYQQNILQKVNSTNDFNNKEPKQAYNIQKISVKQDRTDSNDNLQTQHVETILIKSQDGSKDTINDVKDLNQGNKNNDNTGQKIEDKKEQSLIKIIESTPSVQTKQILTQAQILSTIKQQLQDKQKQTKTENPHIDGATTIHHLIATVQTNAQQKEIVKEDNNTIDSNYISNDSQKLKQSEIITNQTNKGEIKNNSSNQAANFESQIKIIKIQNKEVQPPSVIDKGQPQSENKQRTIIPSNDNAANQSLIESHQDSKDKQATQIKEKIPLDTQVDKYEKEIDHGQDEIKIIQIQKEEIPVESISNQQTKDIPNKPIQTVDHTTSQLNQPQSQNFASEAQIFNNKKDQNIFSDDNTPAANEFNELSDVHQQQHFRPEQNTKINQENDQKSSIDTPNIEQKNQQNQYIVQDKDSKLKIQPQEDITHIYFPIEEEKQQMPLSYFSQESEEISILQISSNSKKQEKSSTHQLRVEKKTSQKQQILTALADQDPQLPKDQIMDTQTIVWLIILTFIVSIPVVRQIRSRGGGKQPLMDDPILKNQKMELQGNSGQYTQVDNGTGLQIEA